MATTFARQLEGLDKIIRAGEMEKARETIKKLATRAVPREHAADLARLAQRTSLPDIGLRVLAKIVRPKARAPVEADDNERAEYAACLVRIGAAEEALRLLDAVDTAQAPRALLYRAFALASRWDYPATIAPLKSYIATPGIGSYQQLVGKMNLAAALVFTRASYHTTSLLNELLHATSAARLPLLHANALELSAEHFILRRDWAQATRCLHRAESALARSGTVYEFLVRKWRFVHDFMRGEVPSLDELRALAAERGHWETVRECDRFTLLHEYDPALATRLYLGTPHEAYRRRIAEEAPGSVALPPTYRWAVGDGDEWIVDLFTGGIRRGNREVASLRPGHLHQRILATLSSDFYRPFRLASLHARLYPEDHFNRVSSRAKVHEAVGALRAWLREHAVPLDVRGEGGAYSLHASGPLAIEIRTGAREVAPRAKEVAQLRERWEKKYFSTVEATELLGLPRRSVQRILSDLVEDGVLKRAGKGGGTRYSF